MSQISAGEAYVSVTVDNEPARRSLQELSVSISDMTKRATSSLLSFVSNFSATGDQFDKMAARTGISAQALSEYGYAAQLCGSSVERVEDAVKSMAQKITDAADKGGEAREAFDALGVSVETLRAQTPEEQFETLAQAVAAVDDPTRRAALALKVFGDAGQNLTPLFSAGSESIKAMREEARSLGVSVSDSSAKLGADYADAVARLSASFAGFKTTLAVAVAPVVLRLSSSFTAFVSKARELVSRFPRLTSAAIGAAGGIGGLAVAFTTISKVVPMATAAFKSFSAVVAAFSLHPVILGITAVVAAVGALAFVASKYFRDKSSAATKSAGEWTREKEEALAAGDAIRSQDSDRMRRLEELARKERLTTSEIAEAARLASELNARYGNIGVSVDAVTGKINLATDAQNKLNKAMLKNEAAQVKKALDEAEKNANYGSAAAAVADKTETTFKDYKEGVGGWRNAIGGFFTLSKNERKQLALQNNAEYEKNVKNELDVRKTNAAALRERYAALTAALEEEETQAAANPYKTQEDAMGSVVSKYQEGTAAELEDEGLNEYERRRARIDREASEQIDELWKAAAPGVDRNGEGFEQWKQDNAGLFQKISGMEEEVRKSANERKGIINREEEKQGREELDRAERENFDQNATAAEKLARADKELEDARKRLDEAKNEEGGADPRKVAAAMQAYNEAQRRKDDATEAVERGKGEEERIAKAREDAERGYFDAYAAPEEKYERAARELDAAIKELSEARKSGDDERLTEALREVVDKQGAFDSVASQLQQNEPFEEATEPIKKSLSAVGTFSAYQAQAWGAGDYQRKLYDQSKEQTSLLRRLVALGNNSRAEFA